MGSAIFVARERTSSTPGRGLAHIRLPAHTSAEIALTGEQIGNFP
jgi:hypothetical protein